MYSASTKVRAAAAEAIAGVFSGRSLDDEMQRVAASLPVRERATLRVMCLGTIRDHARLSAIVARLVPRPPAPHSPSHALLVLGLFQLIHMRSAEYADVNETVNAAAMLGKRTSKGLTNAVLRHFQRQRQDILDSLPDTPEVRHSYPAWLVAEIGKDWGDRAESVLAAGNQRAPLTLRVNTSRSSPEAYLEALSRHGMAARPVPGVPTALTLETSAPVTKLPGYGEGLFAVQDASAQLAARILEPEAGQRVLDACAAPGGKTCHLLEQAPGIELQALEKDSQRLARLRENLSRLRLQAEIICGDGGDPDSWWDGRAYDRILLDAPCSGTGVIRRHPDIKWLRRPSDIPQAAAQQRALLDALWPLLLPGGRLLYATCSILGAEGDGVVGPFLATQADAHAVPLDLDVGEATPFGRRIAPGGAHDGFYYALLEKRG